MSCVRILLLVIFLSHASFANDCIYKLFNGQAKLPATAYREPNARDLDRYIDELGNGVAHGLRKGDVVIDVGSGFGFSVLDLINEKGVRGVAINVQDNYALLTQYKKLSSADWKSKLVIGQNKVRGLVKLESYNGISADVLAQIAEKIKLDASVFSRTKEMSMNIAPAYYQKNIIELAEKVKEMQKNKKFIYEVGYAEEILPKYKNQAKRITDLWGAYSYSPARIELVQSYYQALAPGGKAYVLVPIRVKTGFRYDDVLGEFGLSFEEYLVKRYPQVFSLESPKNASIPSDVLVVKKPLDSFDLDLSNVHFKRVINESESKTKDWAPPIVEYEKIK